MGTLVEAYTPSNKPIAEMTDQEKLDEILVSQRKVLGLMGALVGAAAQHPMMRAMLMANGIEV